MPPSARSINRLSRKEFRYSCRRATKAWRAAMQAAPARPTASASAHTLLRRITSRWAERISQTHSTAPCNRRTRPNLWLGAFLHPGNSLERFLRGQPAFGLYGFLDGVAPTGSATAIRRAWTGEVEVVAGSGGPSNCAAGSPSKFGVASGSCAEPRSLRGRRDRRHPWPDVEPARRFAFRGGRHLEHFYVICNSDVQEWRSAMHRRSQHVGRSGWHLLRLADFGGYSGSGESECGWRAGQSNATCTTRWPLARPASFTASRAAIST